MKPTLMKGEKRMAISDNAKWIVERVYICYGTDSGCLFGLTPSQRRAVEAIVQFVLDDTPEPSGNPYKDFLKLPVAQRREILKKQAQELADHAADSDAWEDKGMCE